MMVKLHLGMPSKAAIAALALTLASGSYALAQTSSIGQATSVQNTVYGTVSGNQKQLEDGNDVFQNEKVHTTASSTAHLQFVDQTKLSLGPQSEVVLDRFVYDPSGGVGDVTMQLGRGTFRFITGTQDKRSYQIKTPVATIGVRGTIFDVINTAVCSIFVIEEGSITLTFANGKTMVLDKAGQGIQACLDGSIIGPQPWPLEPTGSIPPPNPHSDLPDLIDLPTCSNPSCS